MVDQSYSADNFYRILDYENRKGNYKEGEFFSDIFDITVEIKQAKLQYKESRKNLNDDNEKEELRTEFRDQLILLKDQKDNLLLDKLYDVSNNIVNGNWKLELRKHWDSNSEKDIYLTGKNPETFFALKQTQYCIKKLYKVKQSHRNNIVQQVKLLLSDNNAPKVIVRADIKHFYESIGIERLLRKINKDNLLSQLAKKIINRMIREYQRLSGSESGIPRGIGISAYLSELYLREFDNEIRNLPNVYYYARYVDDIIILMSPEDNTNEDNTKSVIAKILNDTAQLSLNEEKTLVHVIKKPNEDLRIAKETEYLGYKFILETGKDLVISLSDKKRRNYVRRIDALCINYKKSNGRKADKKNVVNGVRFLTSNTRLLNNKSNVLIGVYYANHLLTDLTVLNELDQYIQSRLSSVGLVGIADYIQNKGYTFTSGFNTRRFVAFKPNQMNKILSIWR